MRISDWSSDVCSSDLPREIYMSRRTFMGTAAAGFVLAGAGGTLAAPLTASPSPFPIDEMQTPKEAVTTYNNFYEFGAGKSDHSENAQHFKPLPLSVQVVGLVGQQKEFGIEELMKLTLEDGTYRKRCIE